MAPPEQTKKDAVDEYAPTLVQFNILPDRTSYTEDMSFFAGVGPKQFRTFELSHELMEQIQQGCLPGFAVHADEAAQALQRYAMSHAKAAAVPYVSPDSLFTLAQRNPMEP